MKSQSVSVGWGLSEWHRPKSGSSSLVRNLMRSQAYPDYSGEVSHAETHISHVFLTDDRAYKVKKAVRFPFLDYSTLELRLRGCNEEVRLNRRLAPGVYLGVTPVTMNCAGQFQFGGGGTIVDYCVEMKRLPAERMLDHLIEQGTATCEHIHRLLDVLIPFYAQSDRGPEVTQHAMAAVVEANARQNLTMIEAFGQGEVEPFTALPRIRGAQLQFIRFSADLFDSRIKLNRVGEGHGDLRPEHICMLPDRPVVFDCVEFSLPLRAADVISELAFLAMECDFLVAPELGKALIAGYTSQAHDDAPDGLIHFYKSYRACVRAKVELLRADQEVGDNASRSRMRAQRYLQLASSYAVQFYRPKLFVMAGAAGTGKSTVADGLAQTLGLEVLRTDEIRHELAAKREPHVELGQGIYSDSMTGRTYETLFERAAGLLREGVSPVLDGTFRTPRLRHRACQLASQFGAEIHFVRCQCPGDIARDRIAKRIEQANSRSDARPEMFESQQRELESADDWQDLPVVTVDTTSAQSELIQAVIDRVKAVHT